MTNSNDKALKGIPLEQLFMNTTAIEDGEWIEDIDGAPGVKVFTKGWNCAEAVAYRETQLRQRPADLIENTEEFEAAQKSDAVDHRLRLNEVLRRERANLLRDVLIKGWANFGGIPFTPSNLAAICDEDAAMPARQILLNAALQCGRFRTNREDAQLKNFVAGLGIKFDSPESTQIQ